MPANEFRTPALQPIVRHEGRGRAIEISAGRLETLGDQTRFLGELLRAVNLNLARDPQSEGIL